MGKELGYKPADESNGKKSDYSHSQGKHTGTSTSNNHARSKKRQDGVNGDKGSLNAGDHLWGQEESEGGGEAY